MVQRQVHTQEGTVMRIGFIGVGNMGFAMFKGALQTFGKDQLCYTDVSQAVMDRVADVTGIAGMASNDDVVKASDIIVLAIKPQYMAQVLADIRSRLSHRHILITPAAGLNIDFFKTEVGYDVRVVRCMPNTPALVGEGMTGYSLSNDEFNDEEKAIVTEFFESFGKAILLPEHLMDEVVPISGSSPAYFFMMLEAMADAAVLTGLPRKEAYMMGAQTMLGAAKMVLETGEHPGVLKDRVCSPGGTTIEAVKVLEEKGFRSAIIDAMVACYDKTKKFK